MLDQEIVRAFREADVSLVVMAGFMRVVTNVLLDAFPWRVVNIHPALLPAFPGTHGQRQAWSYGAKVAGCTVHFVDIGTDTGPIIAQVAVPVLDADTEESLSARILEQEHRLLIAALVGIASGSVAVVAGEGEGARASCREISGASHGGGLHLTEKHYDVVVLGRSLGALASAALLARRDFRVLVLGQGAPPPSYRWGRRVLRRSAFSMLFGASPAWRRVLVELAQTQTFPTKGPAARPHGSAPHGRSPYRVSPRPEVVRARSSARIPRSEKGDRRALCRARAGERRGGCRVRPRRRLSAGTFWERRETSRLVASLPFARPEPGFDLLARFRRPRTRFAGSPGARRSSLRTSHSRAFRHSPWRGCKGRGRAGSMLSREGKTSSPSFSCSAFRRMAGPAGCQSAPFAFRSIARGSPESSSTAKALPSGPGFVVSRPRGRTARPALGR